MASKWLFNNRRSSIQIIAEILRVSSSIPANKSDIIKDVKVNYQQINNYLDRLTILKLIEFSTDFKGQNCFTATDKGINLLSTIDKIRAILNRH